MDSTVSGFGETLFGGGPFIRWTLTPFLVLFVALMPLLIPSYTPLAIVVMIGMELACLALLAGFWLPRHFGRWAFRILAGTVFLAYVGYFIQEAFLSNKPFLDNRPGASPLKALVGLFCIGLPSFWYALFGRFTVRPPRPDFESDESYTEPEHPSGD